MIDERALAYTLQQELADPDSVHNVVYAVDLSRTGTVAIVSTGTKYFATTHYIYALSNGAWSVGAEVMQSGFPVSVAVSGDGSTALVVTAGLGFQASVHSGQNWSIQATIPVQGAGWDLSSATGVSAALNEDGTCAVIGAWFNQNGLAWVFTRDGDGWSLSATLTNPGTWGFGNAVAISGDGSAIVVGASGGGARGAAYLFTGLGWWTSTALVNSMPTRYSQFGWSVAISDDGSVAAVGDLYGGVTTWGHVDLFDVPGGALLGTVTPTSWGVNGFGDAVALNGSGSCVLVVTESDGSATAFGGPSWGTRAELPVQMGNVGNLNQTVALNETGTVALIGAPCFGSTAGSAAYVVGGTDWDETVALPVNGIAGDGFGSALAVSAKGTTLVAGAPGEAAGSGVVTVFGYDDGSWTPVAGYSVYGGAGGRLGASVAVSADGTTAVVAAPGLGTVYVSNTTDWGDPTVLSEPSGLDADFGASVCMSGDASIAAVGAPALNGNAGGVYVYSGPGWKDQALLVDSSGAGGDNYGYAVAISGDGSTIVVGAPGAGGQTGAAYVLTGDGWSSAQLLSVPTGQPGDAFGVAVGVNIDGSVVLVGAPGAGEGTGAAYVFVSSDWEAPVTLTPPGGTDASDEFGYAVTLSTDGTQAVIGAAGADNQTGLVMLYSAPAWSATATITASDGSPGDAFGSAVGVSTGGATVVVGAPGSDHRDGVVDVYVAG